MMRLGSTGDGERSNGAMAGSRVAFSMVPRVGSKSRMEASDGFKGWKGCTRPEGCSVRSPVASCQSSDSALAIEWIELNRTDGV